MKKTILTILPLLLFVGCDNSTEPQDDIKEVAWLIYNSHGDSETPHLFYATEVVPTFEGTGGGWLVQGDTISISPARFPVRNITHFVEPTLN